MNEAITHSGPGIGRGHCRAAADVDPDTKPFAIAGENVDAAAPIAATDGAGYEAVRR